MSGSSGEVNFVVTDSNTAPELEAIDTAFINGSYGVAENGAVWLYESQLKNRLLPFICQHLVILLKASEILSDIISDGHAEYRVPKISPVKDLLNSYFISLMLEG